MLVLRCLCPQTIGNGYITASGRSGDDAFWYVIDNSTIQGSGKTFLGRPWRNYARVVFQKCTLGSNVYVAFFSSLSAEGWSVDAAAVSDLRRAGPYGAPRESSFSLLIGEKDT